MPVVIWLSPLASASLQTAAPDLWDWRAASFDFTDDEAPRIGALRVMTRLRFGDDLRLSGEQRQARFVWSKTCWPSSNERGRQHPSGRSRSARIFSLSWGSTRRG